MAVNPPKKWPKTLKAAQSEVFGVLETLSHYSLEASHPESLKSYPVAGRLEHGGLCLWLKLEFGSV